MGVGGVNFNYRPSSWVVYIIKPHYKLFPFKWYDLLEEKWVSDGTHVPTESLTMLAERQPLKVVIGMKKLLKED